MQLKGFNAHLPTVADIQAAARMGCSMLRVDFNWFAIEKSQGKYDWGQMDAIVSRMQASGLRVYATLAYTPRWHRARISQVPLTSEWCRFVTSVSSRYGSGISVYGMWNEPNLSQFWEGTMDDYVGQILIPGAILLRRQKLRVAAPDLSTSGHAWPEWLSFLVKQQQLFDILSIHCYKDTMAEVTKAFLEGSWQILQWAVPSWRPYRRWLDKLSVPVWLTEVGWDSADIGSIRQAVEYHRLITKAPAFLDTVLAYELKDDPNIFAKWGVLDSTGAEKEAVNVVKNALRAS